MTSIAAIAIAFAGVCFCVMHIVARVIDYKREAMKKDEIEKVTKEMEDEIKHNGNIARIAALRARLLELRKEA